MAEYTPYLAEWPGLSARPSPPMVSGVPLSASRVRSPVWCNCHWCCTDGSNTYFWCKVKVLSVMVATFMYCRMRRVLLVLPPAKRMLADRRTFPAGVAPKKGWLSHLLEAAEHSKHSLVTLRRVPTSLFVTRTAAQPQAGHIWRSSINLDSNTIYFVSSCGWHWRGSHAPLGLCPLFLHKWQVTYAFKSKLHISCELISTLELKNIYSLNHISLSSFLNRAVFWFTCITIDHMHMTSQKGAQLRWGSNETLPRASSPSMQPGGQTLQATPPGWPARARHTDTLFTLCFLTPYFP